MTAAVRQKLTYEEYLQYDDGTDTHYEYDDGDLIEMPPAIRLHRKIAQFLEECFRREIESIKKQWETARADAGVKTRKLNGKMATRFPDLMVFDATTLDSNEVDILDFAPEMAIEIVSKGAKNRKRDYEDKRYEYRVKGIKEYWIIDPEHQKITVFLLDKEADFYEQEEYRGDQIIRCNTFKSLKLPAETIFRAGK